MKGVPVELTARSRRPPGLDLPRVLVAAATSEASGTIGRALRDTGYVVSTTLARPDLFRDLRNQNAIELLVLGDASDGSWSVGPTLEAVRATHWALPIILIARADPALRAEAEWLGVEAILEAPVSADEIRRAATRIVPVIPEMELDLAG